VIHKLSTDISTVLSTSAKKAGISAPKVHLEHPEVISHGDWSTNVAMVHAKELKTNPRALAEKIVEEFKKEMPKGVAGIEIAGPGFINIRLARNAFVENVGEIAKEGETYGEQNVGEGTTVVVEYSSPNIAKPFTVGHLRSTIIGDAVANIFAALGYDVVRDNHLGDWGTQFGKLIVAIKKWGSVEEIKKSADPMRVLVDLYVRFHKEAETDASLEDEGRAWFAKLEKGDGEAQEIWQLCIERSLFAFDKIYKELGVSFDTMRGESLYGKDIPLVVKELEKKNLLKDSEGAKVVFFEGEKYPPLIIQKKDGASIYATRDLATDYWRKNKYGKNFFGMKKNLLVINEVGAEQTLYFRQLFEIERMLGWYKEGERVHVMHGHYRWQEGKMSTRQGNVIWLEDIIKEIKERAVARALEEKKEAVGIDEIAIGALKFNDLKRDAAQDIVFDYDEMMNMTGDSGPYLQYACVRAKSVIAKAGSLGIKPTLNPNPESSPEAENLEKMLVRFPEVIARSAEQYKPNLLAGYLINLASYFNNFYAHNTIANTENKNAAHNVALTEAFVVVIENGLKLLGIKVPKRM
jgi:arginyl-tRNA synthetase